MPIARHILERQGINKKRHILEILEQFEEKNP